MKKMKLEKLSEEYSDMFGGDDNDSSCQVMSKMSSFGPGKCAGWFPVFPGEEPSGKLGGNGATAGGHYIEGCDGEFPGVWWGPLGGVGGIPGFPGGVEQPVQLPAHCVASSKYIPLYLWIRWPQAGDFLT